MTLSTRGFFSYFRRVNPIKALYETAINAEEMCRRNPRYEALLGVATGLMIIAMTTILQPHVLLAALAFDIAVLTISDLCYQYENTRHIVRNR